MFLKVIIIIDIDANIEAAHSRLLEECSEANYTVLDNY